MRHLSALMEESGVRIDNGKKTTSLVRRSAGEVKAYRTLRRVIPAISGAVVVLLIIVYIISLLFSRYGSFTVKVDDLRNRDYSLSLCENARFLNPVSRLNSKAVKNVTNIDGNSLPGDLNDVDGEHNGENYVAYTFYCKNTGIKEVKYNYQLVISRKTAGIDAAVRVRVYYNPFYYRAEDGQTTLLSDYTDYAKPRNGGNGEPEIDPEGRVMTNFAAGDTIMEGITEGFRPGDISKVTVVIWLEGNDPECVDDILGGEFKVDMIMSIVGETGENTDADTQS